VSVWIKDKEWRGNPALGLESWHKIFVNPRKNDKKTRVYVFGRDAKWSFCVDDGPNGDFSYTGCAPTGNTAQDTMDYLDQVYPQGIFY
jgi:hypothetical protein